MRVIAAPQMAALISNSPVHPGPRPIAAGAEGKRLLAGYRLRRSADRVSSRMSGDPAEVHLHDDH